MTVEDADAELAAFERSGHSPGGRPRGSVAALIVFPATEVAVHALRQCTDFPDPRDAGTLLEAGIGALTWPPKVLQQQQQQRSDTGSAAGSSTSSSSAASSSPSVSTSARPLRLEVTFARPDAVAIAPPYHESLRQHAFTSAAAARASADAMRIFGRLPLPYETHGGYYLPSAGAGGERLLLHEPSRGFWFDTATGLYIDATATRESVSISSSTGASAAAGSERDSRGAGAKDRNGTSSDGTSALGSGPRAHVRQHLFYDPVGCFFRVVEAPLARASGPTAAASDAFLPLPVGAVSDTPAPMTSASSTVADSEAAKAGSGSSGPSASAASTDSVAAAAAAAAAIMKSGGLDLDHDPFAASSSSVSSVAAAGAGAVRSAGVGGSGVSASTGSSSSMMMIAKWRQAQGQARTHSAAAAATVGQLGSAQGTAAGAAGAPVPVGTTAPAAAPDSSAPRPVVTVTRFGGSATTLTKESEVATKRDAPIATPAVPLPLRAAAEAAARPVATDAAAAGQVAPAPSTTTSAGTASTMGAPGQPTSTPAPTSSQNSASTQVNAICRLCRRGFPSQAALDKHDSKSDLHKSNLAAFARGEIDADGKPTRLGPAAATATGGAGAAGSGAKTATSGVAAPAAPSQQGHASTQAPTAPSQTALPVPASAGAHAACGQGHASTQAEAAPLAATSATTAAAATAYRDRAAERRKQFGIEAFPATVTAADAAADASSSVSSAPRVPTAAETLAAAAAKPLDLSESAGPGARMMAKMGFTPGVGLGRNADGATAPVDASAGMRVDGDRRGLGR